MFNRSKAWAFGLLGTTFLAGLLMGGGVQQMLRADSSDDNRREKRRGYVEYLTDELTLDVSQHAAVSRIVDESRSEMKALSESIRPKYDSIRSGVRDRVREQLTPEQVAAFELMIQRSDERRRNRAHDRDR